MTLRKERRKLSKNSWEKIWKRRKHHHHYDDNKYLSTPLDSTISPRFDLQTTDSNDAAKLYSFPSPSNIFEVPVNEPTNEERDSTDPIEKHLPRQTNPKTISLYTALQASYGIRNAIDEIQNAGYREDPQLSTERYRTFYNPSENHLLFGVRGTNVKEWRDLYTDYYLLTGRLKATDRYKEADQALEQARDKYDPAKVTLFGHSLGATIASYAKQKSDQFYGLNEGVTFFQPTRSDNGNSHHYRIKGDVVSLLGSNSANMKTLTNTAQTNGILGPLYTHTTKTVENQPIYINR